MMHGGQTHRIAANIVPLNNNYLPPKYPYFGVRVLGIYVPRSLLLVKEVNERSLFCIGMGRLDPAVLSVGGLNCGAVSAESDNLSAISSAPWPRSSTTYLTYSYKISALPKHAKFRIGRKEISLKCWIFPGMHLQFYPNFISSVLTPLKFE